MSEEQQIGIEIGGVRPPGGIFLIGDSQIDKAARPETPKCLCLLLCFYKFSAANFLLYLAWYDYAWDNPHCL